MYFNTNTTHLRVHMTCWVCKGNFVYYLAVQPIHDMTYMLSNLAKRVILYKSPALKLFEQHSYISVMFHVQAIRHLNDR